MSIPILTLVCGAAPPAIANVHGDYLRWFQDGLGDRVKLVPWQILEGQMQPPLDEFAGVLITGTPASLTAPEPWMEVAIECIREAAECQTPLLGVCFGHQLIGCAFGAPTIRADGNGEHGSHAISLTSEGGKDLLFDGLPSHFETQLTHYDKVDERAVTASNGLRVLASSSQTPIQALAAGKYIRSVQFHPEFSQSIMASYLRADDLDPKDSHECPHAASVFDNWVTHWVLPRT